MVGLSATLAALDAVAQAAPPGEAGGAPALRMLQDAWQGALQGAWHRLQRPRMWAVPVAACLAVVAAVQCIDMNNGVPAPSDRPCLACVAADLISGACFLGFPCLPWVWMEVLRMCWQALRPQQPAQQAAHQE